MPPEDETQPKSQDKIKFLEMLSGKLVDARNMLNDTGGKITMRRLNRREYKNTMEDLLGVSVNASTLPDDFSSSNFDNDGTNLFLSADQIQQYLMIARSSIEDALRHKTLDKPLKIRYEPETQANEGVTKRHSEYLRRYKGAIAYEKSQKAGENKQPKDFGIIDKAEVKFAKDHYERFFASYDDYLKNSLSKTGVLMSLRHPILNFSFKIDWFDQMITIERKNGTERKKKLRTTFPNGVYKIRARVALLPNSPPERSFLDLGFMDKEKSFNRLRTFQVTAPLSNPQIIEQTVVINSENRLMTFREKSTESTAFFKYEMSRRETGKAASPTLWIDWVEYEGPLPSKKQPLLSQTIAKINSSVLKSDQIKPILKDFAQKVFRRGKVEDSYTDRLIGLYEEELSVGLKPKEAIVEPLSVILSSPSFLFLAEPTASLKKRLLTQNELAIRLSYFLWSSAPDLRLQKIAAAGKLKGEILRKEVDRMLKDERVMNFIRSYTYQWLGIERLNFFKFDARKYPEFDDSLKAATEEEIYQTIKLIIDQKLDTGKLLKSDFVVINALLANHYGITGVAGDEFRKVTLPKNSVRGGLTGMAAILAMGSDGNHTSPVERGAWVLRKILNQPPPPAPANVPQLSRLESKKLSARQILKAHQEEAQCAHCHKKIDPIGVGMENFDADGTWRTHVKLGNKKHTIDPSGAIYRGPSFKGYVELRDFISSKTDDFNRGLITSLLSYSMNRKFGFSDQDLINGLQKKMKRNKNSLHWLIHEIVQLEDFKIKR